jgi:hypothetical protein
MVKAGFYGAKKVQLWKCQQRNKRFSEPQPKPFGEDIRLPLEKVTMILRCLAEGNSVRSTARPCDVEKRTVLNLLKTAGEYCEMAHVGQAEDIGPPNLAGFSVSSAYPLGEPITVRLSTLVFPQPVNVHPTLTLKFQFADTGIDYRERSMDVTP